LEIVNVLLLTSKFEVSAASLTFTKHDVEGLLSGRYQVYAPSLGVEFVMVVHVEPLLIEY